MMTNEQQIELDAWLAENEQMQARFASDRERSYAEGYNAGSRAAAEAVRQQNWTLEEYQEHLGKLKSA
jgi:hypothetical protein